MNSTFMKLYVTWPTWPKGHIPKKFEFSKWFLEFLRLMKNIIFNKTKSFVGRNTSNHACQIFCSNSNCEIMYQWFVLLEITVVKVMNNLNVCSTHSYLYPRSWFNAGDYVAVLWHPTFLVFNVSDIFLAFVFVLFCFFCFVFFFLVVFCLFVSLFSPHTYIMLHDKKKIHTGHGTGEKKYWQASVLLLLILILVYFYTRKVWRFRSRKSKERQCNSLKDKQWTSQKTKEIRGNKYCNKICVFWSFIVFVVIICLVVVSIWLKIMKYLTNIRKLDPWVNPFRVTHQYVLIKSFKAIKISWLKTINMTILQETNSDRNKHSIIHLTCV